MPKPIKLATCTMARVLSLASALSILATLVACTALAYRPATNAMAPTLTSKDMCVVDPSAYNSGGEVKRFDIVVYEVPDAVKRRTNQQGDVRVVKRVIGVPGEMLEIRNNALYINNQLVDEPFEKMLDEHDPKRNYGPILIPENRYFIAGDNRPSSEDSRYNEHGLIGRDAIFSKVTKNKSGYYKD